jgi:hypothetical protein
MAKGSGNRRRRLGYADVMSSIAVFLLLSGAGAYATTTLAGGGGSAAATGDQVLAGSKGEQFRRAVARWEEEEVPVSVSIQGDSITAGYGSGAGTFNVNSFGAILQEMLLEWLGGYREEFSLVGETDDKRWSSTGTWSPVNQGPGRTAVRTSDGGTKTWGPVYCKQFVVYSIDEEGGAGLEAKVDGGAWTTVASTNAAPSGVRATVIGAGSLAEHTLSIRPGSSSAPLTVVGLAGLEVGKTTQFKFATRVFRMGYPSAKISKITTDSSPVDALRTGFTLPRIGLPANKAGADLDVIAFSSNDYNQQTEPALYRSQLKTAGETAEALGGSVLFVAMPEPNIPAKPIPWTEYRDAMESVAEEVDAGFLDLDEALGPRTGTLYKEAFSDTFHPTALYHREIAQRIFEVLWFPGA